MDAHFDGNDWGNVYDHYVPKTAAYSPAARDPSAGVAAGGALPPGSVDPEVERMARAIEKCANHSSKAGKEDHFNINILPEEVRKRYLTNGCTNEVTLKRNLARFKNDLTKHNGATLALNFIRFPQNHYSSYIIMKNGTAFRYLKNQTDKQREAFIKKFPKLEEWCAESFYY